MAVDALVLAANPGSASRKYALYSYGKLLASLHFEFENGQIICTLEQAGNSQKLYPNIQSLEQTPQHIVPMLKQAGVKLKDGFKAIGLRTVAPTGEFLNDCLLNKDALKKLATLERIVPLHIHATLQEAQALQTTFNGTPIVLVSDSAFHITKPDYAWNYAINLEDADRFDIKRFGYHGISLAAIVRELRSANKLPEKLIICHLGSGASVTAVLNGQSLDTSMGFSPLEGLMMATRSGNIDVLAAHTLQKQLKFKTADLENYLNKYCGLLGVSGFSSDIRELLDAENNGHYRAGLALRMYVNRIQQAIGQMAASLGGVDALLFTGTVGCRSCPIRQRVVANLGFLGLAIDENKNHTIIEPAELKIISLPKRQKPIYVITTDENQEIAARALALIYPL